MRFYEFNNLIAYLTKIDYLIVALWMIANWLVCNVKMINHVQSE